MRHPVSGLGEDDLGRLTGSMKKSLSSTSSVRNFSDTNNVNDDENSLLDESKIAENQCHHNNNNINNNNSYQHCRHYNHHVNDYDLNNFKNSLQNNYIDLYLPKIIDTSSEWQKTRKRKEQKENNVLKTSNNKLIRSNSEELLSISDCEVIRRVSSHEDFKKSQNDIKYHGKLQLICGNNRIQDNDNNIKDLVLPFSSLINQDAQDYDNTAYLLNDDYYEFEHEKRRSSERSCKSRASYGGRKNVTFKKPKQQQQLLIRYRYSVPNISTVTNEDNNKYKYDISTMKYERRGFVSKVQSEKRNRKLEATDGERIIDSSNDYNDNNLIDFRICYKTTPYYGYSFTSPVLSSPPSPTSSSSSSSLSLSPSPTSSSSLTSTSQKQQQQQQVLPIDTKSSSAEQLQQQQDSQLSSKTAFSLQQQQQQNVQYSHTIAEALPWNSTRFCNNDNDTLKFESSSSSDSNSKIIPKTNKQQQISDEIDYPTPAVVINNEPVKCFRNFNTNIPLKIENLKIQSSNMRTQQNTGIPPQNFAYLQKPEERLSQINKKIQSLKKRLEKLEELYEKNYGYKPSQVEKYNDKKIKNILVEIGKLQKEKHELKSNPTGLKIKGSLDNEIRVNKIKETIADIEKVLNKKRIEENRPEKLDELNADQLIQEKIAIQHGLLHLESLYGRPATKQERDIARPLYDRYRTIKRLVCRSSSLTGNGNGIPELPTILENEAMTFSGTSLNLNSTDKENDIEDALELQWSPDEPHNTSATTLLSEKNTKLRSDDYNATEIMPNSTTTTPSSSDLNSTNVLIQNIQTLSLDELYRLLDKAKEEEKRSKCAIKEYEMLFEEQNGRKMLKADRKIIDDTYKQYKQKKSKVRLLRALIKKHVPR